jgi:hypothetical protein
MILPEIEEEEEEGQKLSLTSLLLGDSSATVLYKVHVNSKYKKKQWQVFRTRISFVEIQI